MTQMQSPQKPSNPAQGVELSIICVNWNSIGYLRKCLQTVFANEIGATFEVIVVDNASTAREDETLRTEFPSIKAIRSAENLGFARANNLAFKQSSGRYILFLNPDTEVLGSAIETLLKRIKEIANAGIVSPRLLHSDGSLEINCIQRFPRLFSQALNANAIRRRWSVGIDPALYDRRGPAEVEVVPGTCLMIRREAFEKAGFFNEEYFMYGEDLELCDQVRRMGLKTFYVGEAQVIHHGGGATRSRRGEAWAAVMQRKALLRFCRRTRGLLYTTLFRVVMAGTAMFRLLIMTVLLPFSSKREMLAIALSKWSAILWFAIGFERHVTTA